MRMRVLAALLFLVPTVFGCASSNYLVDKPLVLYPQNAANQTDGEIQARSMKALLAAFSDYNWEIRRIDHEQGIVIAEACRRGQHCAEVQATVLKNGMVEIYRTPGQKLSEDEGVLLQRWLGRIKAAYEKKMKRGG